MLMIKSIFLQIIPFQVTNNNTQFDLLYGLEYSDLILKIVRIIFSSMGT